MLLGRRVGSRGVGRVLESGSRWVRNGTNVIGRITCVGTDHLSVDHGRVIQVKLAVSVVSGRHTLAHFEEGVHLLLATDLAAQDTVVAKVVWLMDV